MDVHPHLNCIPCVCVAHLYRCKTSGFLQLSAGGGCMVWQSSTNEDTAFPWWYDEGTPLSRTCFIFGHGMWPTQEPPRRFQTIYFTWFYMVAAIWFWMTIYLPFLEFGLGYVGYFRKTFIVFAKYNHEIYFRFNCLGLLHVTGFSSWWISSKIQFCLVCAQMFGSSTS